jgi:hypothetical protein
MKNLQAENEDLDQHLEAEIRRITKATPDEMSPRDWRSMRETLRLAILYPDEYVIYRDHNTGRGRNMRLRSREVAFHSPGLKEAQDFLISLGKEGDLYNLTYVGM